MLVTVIASAEGQLVTNGNFEANPIGTSVSLPLPPGGGDATTFTGWRIYNSSGGAEGFAATIVANGATHAMQLDITNSQSGTATSENWGLDNIFSKVPVAFGGNYSLTFDAAHISGETSLLVAIDQWDASSNWLGAVGYYVFTVSDTNYQAFSVPNWTPTDANVTGISIMFRPVTSLGGSQSVSFSDVQVVPEPGAISLMFAGAAFLLILSRKKCHTV